MKYYSCLICILLGNFLSAQSVILGTITDSIENPVVAANIFLEQKESQAIVAFAYSNSNGEYILNTNEQGALILSFSGSLVVQKH